MARGTITEDRYISPTIETVRVVNVNIQDWSVDCVGEHANKIFFDVQVMSPYFHFFNGEGFYCMPEVGAVAWICKPSDGRFSQPFIMGFQAPFDENNVSYRCNRQNLNPGDIMLRTRDENFLILRRGGVVQIGATQLAQRIYIPIRNFIKDFCENYGLYGLGGELTWLVDRTDQTTDGSAPTTLRIKVKEKADNPQHVALITMGSNPDDGDVILDLVVNDSGGSSPVKQVGLVIKKNGEVEWTSKGIWSVAADKNIVLDTKQDLKASAAMNVDVQAGTNMNMKAGAAMDMKAATIKGTAGTIEFDGQVILGSPAAQPLALYPAVQAAFVAVVKYVDPLVGFALSQELAGIYPNMPTKMTIAT